ncbi:MAG: cation diffusion facilitator family transporter, partial [Solobacterium sp.]|nr:cation diffusion facilitator family transporter [Solobacterium sp.]
IISAIVLYAGITSFVESIKKIIEPEIPSYTAPTLIIVFVGVIAKIVLGRYTEAVGKKVDSHSLVDSGKDALNDAVLSFSTLIAALFFLWQKISLEAYLGVIISIFIIKSGVEMLKETLQRILGERADSDLAKAIKATTCSIEGVEGAYDLVLHDYGPENTVGSVHVEVSEKLSAKEIDLLERKIKDKVLQEHSVFLEAISIYAQNEGNPEVIRMRDEVKDILFKHQGVIQMHGFYLNQKEKTMQFDVVVDFDCDRPKQRFNEAVEAVKKQYPEYTITAAYDRDTSD